MDIKFLEQSNGKIIIPVKNGIRYISEWPEFSLDLFEIKIPYIIDKQIPGCGFTEYCLTNKDNMIICSPRRILLENKESQHPGEIFYAKNENDQDSQIDKEIGKKPKKGMTDIRSKVSENLKSIEEMERKLIAYCYERVSLNKPIKIIVTYDSFKYVKRILQNQGGFNLLSTFKIVIDEFQSVFIDSHFKADTEFKFVTELQDLCGKNNICFVSATPMLDKYLKELDEFKNLPYYELDWAMLDSDRVKKPDLTVRHVKSLHSEIKRIIDEYKSGKYNILPNPTTFNPVESTEAVFYVNSVKEILDIIKKTELHPDEVNVLCSDTEYNRKQIKKLLGSDYQIGKIPLRGEPHKMFTFCTRTVYLGADFYSTCARTFVFSNANVDSLSVDISLDLPQILGRQRLIENPWKNKAEFYYKTIGNNKKVSIEEFNLKIETKLAKTNNILLGYESMVDTSKSDYIEMYYDLIALNNYSKDYISVNYIGDKYVPVLNKLVLISEQRAFDIQQVDYKDRFSVFNTIRGERNLEVDKISLIVSKLRDTSIKFSERLKYLCETDELNEDEKTETARQANEYFDNYYNLLGPERCKATGYNVTLLKKEISNKLIPTEEIKTRFQSIFIIGEKYSNIIAKESIRKIYSELGMNRTPKATDLEDYFEIKKIKLVDSTGKSVHGIKILGTK